MHPDKQKFLAYIDENWYDQSCRLIYADWLEENGEYEEAARQRNWWESKNWLLGFAKKWNFFDCTGSYGDYVYREGGRRHHIAGKVLSDREIIERLIKECEEHPNKDWCYLVAEGIDLHRADELGGDDKLFWQHLEIVSGNKFSEDHKENFEWSCSC